MIATCDECQRRMDPDNIGCTDTTWALPNRFGWACGDCFVQTGAYHHPGCLVARCATCGDQAAICGAEHLPQV